MPFSKTTEFCLVFTTSTFAYYPFNLTVSIGFIIGFVLEGERLSIQTGEMIFLKEPILNLFSV